MRALLDYGAAIGEEARFRDIEAKNVNHCHGSIEAMDRVVNATVSEFGLTSVGCPWFLS